MELEVNFTRVIQLFMNLTIPKFREQKEVLSMKQNSTHLGSSGVKSPILKVDRCHENHRICIGAPPSICPWLRHPLKIFLGLVKVLAEVVIILIKFLAEKNFLLRFKSHVLLSASCVNLGQFLGGMLGGYCGGRCTCFI